MHSYYGLLPEISIAQHKKLLNSWLEYHKEEHINRSVNRKVVLTPPKSYGRRLTKSFFHVDVK